MHTVQDMLDGQGAERMQAVPNMLEVVPSGVNKQVGLDLLLEDLQLPREAVMAIGDGGNDLHIVSHAGIGVAMGNAVPEVSSMSIAMCSEICLAGKIYRCCERLHGHPESEGLCRQWHTC